MTLIYQNSRVQTPSAAPSVNTSGGSFRIAHRRINLQGGASRFSPVALNVTLPVTATPQSYSDSSNHLRDEFLVSSDGAIWYIVPRASNGKGAQVISSLDTSWPTTSDVDTQTNTLDAINLGSFSSSDSATFDFVVANTGAPIGTLTAHVNTQLNEIAANYSGLISIELLGYFPANGAGNIVTTSNKAIIWQAPSRGLNIFTLPLQTNSFAKFRVGLINLPGNGNIDATIDLDLSFVGNQRIYPIGLDAQWLNLSLLYEPSMGFNATLLEVAISGTIRLKPFAINYNGRAVINPTNFEQPFNGSFKVLVGQQGQITIVPVATSTPEGYIELASASLSGTNLTNVEVKYPFNAPHNVLGNANLGRFQLVQINNAGTALELCNNINRLIGVTAFDGANGTYINGRIAWVHVTEAVIVGDRLNLSSTPGKAAKSNSGDNVIGVALSAASANGYILADLSYIKINGASGGDFVETAEKGQPNGVATLDGSGFVTSTQLPSNLITETELTSTLNDYVLEAELGDFVDSAELTTALNGYIPTSQKGVASGVATLDSSALVPFTQLPSELITASELSSSLSSYVTSSSLTSTLSNYLPTSQKAAANGVASLDASTKVPVAQIPSEALYKPPTGKVEYLPVTISGTSLYTDENGWLWYPATGRTIGNSSSGAQFADNRLQGLYALLWNNASAAVSGWSLQTSTGAASTVGASASADWAANKRLVVPDMRGRSPLSAGQGSTLTNRVAGSQGGAETHVLSSTEMPSHTHTATVTDPGHAHATPFAFTAQSTNNLWTVQVGGSALHGFAGQTNTNATGIGVSNANTGGGAAHNNMQPFNVYSEVWFTGVRA